MIIALAAVGFKNGDTAYNKEKILETMGEYSGKADLVLFGETFLQGFDSLSWNYEEDLRTAVSADDPVIGEIREAAERNRIAVSFGYVEKEGDVLYSSQMTIGADGEIVNNFRRVSIGWKEPEADSHYQEGKEFPLFEYLGRKFTVGLCGDLWYEENIQKLKEIPADIVLWPVYTDYPYEEWNKTIKLEYAEQVSALGKPVLYVNSVCLEREGYEIARGGAALFENGEIKCETPSGKESVLLVEC